MTSKTFGMVLCPSERKGRKVPRSEAQKRAEKKYKAKYLKESTKSVNIRFFPTDMYIYDHLSTVENKTGYIKELIKADMEKAK